MSEVDSQSPHPSEDPSFKRHVTITAAFDRRHPDPAKNYGIHGCELRMVLEGPEGATQFVLYTGWNLLHVDAEFEARGELAFLRKPMPADLGYHWRMPRYEGQRPVQDSCEYCGGGVCYYDGSTLNAERIFKVLLAEGSEGVWRELEAFYRDLAAREEAA